MKRKRKTGKIKETDRASGMGSSTEGTNLKDEKSHAGMGDQMSDKTTWCVVVSKARSTLSWTPSLTRAPRVAANDCAFSETMPRVAPLQPPKELGREDGEDDKDNGVQDSDDRADDSRVPRAASEAGERRAGLRRRRVQVSEAGDLVEEAPASPAGGLLEGAVRGTCGGV